MRARCDDEYYDEDDAIRLMIRMAMLSSMVVSLEGDAMWVVCHSCLFGGFLYCR